ncbi:MAG: hypothetical protein A2W93_04750 [Bacteroidetes bacterium GWF2_43_63]|nr:MAG: hypothetical protein A2W94_12740 [Bacteroidetes bacterium GWE2_42_42]OFY56065.1 MAG: hypothetical protein A2W93_04750 [Bacteroidetes bacterium GWF2_43_63]
MFGGTINNFVLWNIYGFATWLFPAFILYSRSSKELYAFIKVVKRISIFGLVVGIVFLCMQYFTPISIRRFSSAMLFGSCLLLIIFVVYGLRSKRNLIILGVIIFFLLAFSSNKREDLLFALIMFSGLLIFTHRKHKKWKVFLYVFSALVLFFVVLQPEDVIEFSERILPQKIKINDKSISELLFEDSRGTLPLDFYEDIKSDLLTGRGLVGMYATPTFSPYYDQNFGGRDIIEIGYLQIILKGGVLLLITYLIIIIKAVSYGLWRTKNTLTKIFAFAIIVHMLVMFWARVPAADPYFMLLWLLAGFCLSKSIRNLTNDQIKTALKHV